MPAPAEPHHTGWPERQRPPKEERHVAVMRVLERHGEAMLRAARRFALDCDDAEDAFQRGIEIALQKAPATDPGELVPWLRTVIKHEAFALRRKTKGARPSSDEPEAFERAGTAPDTAEVAETRERLATAAAALAELKPQEARALRLRVQGLSYAEIRAATGWTYTKVNRCVTEGRAHLRRAAAEIEGARE